MSANTCLEFSYHRSPITLCIFICLFLTRHFCILCHIQIHKISPGAGDEKTTGGAKDAEDSPKSPAVKEATWSLEDTSKLRRLVEGYTHGGK